MKRILAAAPLIYLITSLAAAQEIQGDRVVVPARNRTRPRLVKIETHNGSVNVKAYNGNEVSVETKGRERRAQANREGMHRLNLPPTGLEVEEEDNVVTLRRATSGEGDIAVPCPTNTSLN